MKRATSLIATMSLALGSAAGCAALLSIPDRSPEWCARPENAHDFCEDFDHAEAGSRWQRGSLPGATMSYIPSADTPPNAIGFSATPQAFGAKTVAGLYRQFSDHKFQHVRIGVDIHFVSTALYAEGGVESQVGFLLLAEQDFCVGVVLTPGNVGIVMRAHATDCTSVSNLPEEAGAIVDDAGLTSYAPVSPIPGSEQWHHLTLDVKRKPDGSGAVAFDLDYPGVVAPPQIPPGFVTETIPTVALATSVVGPSGRIALEFDNVTVDFPSD